MVGEELPESRGSTGWPPRGGPPFIGNMSYWQEENRGVCTFGGGGGRYDMYIGAVRPPRSCFSDAAALPT